MKKDHAHPLTTRWLHPVYRFNDTKLLHPISVHIPNGMVPVAGLFILSGCLFHIQALVMAAYLNLGIIFLAMPGVMVTGFASWQHRYKGARTRIFHTKIICSGLIFLLSGIILLVQTRHPVTVDHLTGFDWGIVAAYLLLLIPTVRAGALGGILVFGGRKKR